MPESASERNPQLAMNAVAYDAMSSPRYCSGELRNPPSLVCFVVTSISLLFSTLFSSSSPNNEPYLNTLKASILRDKSATTVSQPSTQNLTLSPPNLTSTLPDHLRHRIISRGVKGVMQFPHGVLGRLQRWIVGGDRGERRNQGKGKTTPSSTSAG